MELNQFPLNYYILQTSDLDINWLLPGVYLNIKMLSYQYRDPMLKIRRPRDRLIINMGIPISGKDDLYIETGPWYLHSSYTGQE